MGKHYVYRHIRTDTNVPFYIGIGTKSKDVFGTHVYEYYRAFKFLKRNNHWNGVFTVCDKQINVDILYESDNYEKIKEKEKEFIKLYGRVDLGLGTLVNFTDGGDGNLGILNTKNKSEKIAEANRKRVIKQETRDKISKSSKGNKHYLKRKKTRTGPHSEETKMKISLSNKGRIGKRPSDEDIARFVRFNTGRKLPPETWQKMKLERSFRIGQYSIDGNLIAIHTGQRDAAKSIGAKQANIWSCVNGKTKTCGKFIWRKMPDVKTF